MGSEGPGARTPAYEFVNGRWYVDGGFREERFYSADGTLTRARPGGLIQVVDLTGRFVIPPFGEAHNHNVEWNGPREFARLEQMYLRSGIFYVKNPNNLPRARAPLLGKVNRPTSIDVVFANGGLTATGGHPEGIVRRNTERGAMTEADGVGGFYYVVDDIDALDRQWDAILADEPDFLKTYLLYAEEHDRRKEDPAYADWRGLDPALLPEIVRRAHRAGLRVSTHVETAADFHHALVADVDEINHLPGFRPQRGDWLAYDPERYRISDSDAELAADRGVAVVTTLVAAVEHVLRVGRDTGDGSTDAVRELLVDNLRTLDRHRVRLAIGSDSYRQTSLEEALGLHALGVFDNARLLDMWCVATVETIFPGRRVGRLDEGFEASLLALRGDPLQDFANVRRIDLRVKQGQLLVPADGSAPGDV